MYAMILGITVKQPRPAGLHAMGRKRQGVQALQGSTPVLVGCDQHYPLLLPCSAKACTQCTLTDASRTCPTINLP